jgi:hypothetical protein
MKTIKTILMAAAIGFGVFTLATAPAAGAEEEKAKVEKCDRQGNVCTSGTECNVVNCKKQKENR